MSSNQHKRSASPSGDRDASLNKRQKRDDEKDEKKDEKEEKKREELSASAENQLDEKEEKKEREVKEDITAAALPMTDPDLVVGTVDKDLICAVCFALLTKPTGSLFPCLALSCLLFLSCLSSLASLSCLVLPYLAFPRLVLLQPNLDILHTL
jgi:hypothetical protein